MANDPIAVPTGVVPAKTTVRNKAALPTGRLAAVASPDIGVILVARATWPNETKNYGVARLGLRFAF